MRILEETFSAAAEGTGSVIVIEAPAGLGKSRLITVAGDMAREAGMQILGAHCNEFEREFAFGVAIQLFEPRRKATAVAEWDPLLSGPAGLARGLIEAGRLEEQLSPGAQEYSLIHGLFWLTSNIVSPPVDDVPDSPLVLLVDDVHWADRSSLRFFQYLSKRIADLPVVLVLSLRPEEESADPRALEALRHSGAAVRLQPDALSSEGVAALVRREFPDAEQEFIAMCAALSRGNPFLLVELLAQVRADGLRADADVARRLRGLAPEAIVNVVVSRLGGMPNATRALVLAVSVLGDGASLRHAAQLAGLESHEAAEAADALASMSIFHAGEPLSFVHPLIRSAVVASTSPLALGRAHRRAAKVLSKEEASTDVVAEHLVLSPPEADARAVEVLRTAAGNALSRGAADSAVRLLERAAAEPPEARVVPDLIAELAHAEALAGSPRAIERLTEAITVTSSPERRAELALAQSRTLYAQGRFSEAATAAERALSESARGSEHLVPELEAAYVAAASLVPHLRDELAPRRARLLERAADPRGSWERIALAHLATHEAILGAPRERVRLLADLAWAEGALIDGVAAGGLGWQLVTVALLFVDELERMLEICAAALTTARERDSPVLAATAGQCGAWPLYEQGRITQAIAQAEAAAGPEAFGWPTQFRTPGDALACCHLERGELAPSEALLDASDDPALEESYRRPFLLDVRARLRLAQHRPSEALADALAAGEVLESFAASAASPGVVAWRSTAAFAHLALGDAGSAAALAAQELEQARSLGITRVMLRDLRALGLATGGSEGLRFLEEAVALGDRHPARLEFVYALLSLGAALRRSNKRAAARDPLRRALQLAHRGGIAAAASRAEIELAATGARPRREMLTGVESLTPSERRVADLAAQGLTTRQIAESLFVTPKTVEFHLRHVYQKLEISSRVQLPDALRR